MITADQALIEHNKKEIHKAFAMCEVCIICFVFSTTGGRLTNDDIIAFNAVSKAYNFNVDSLVLAVNCLKPTRPSDYDAKMAIEMQKLLTPKVPETQMCFLDEIDITNADARNRIGSQLWETILSRTAQKHEITQEILLTQDILEKEREKTKKAQAEMIAELEQYKSQIEEAKKAIEDLKNRAIQNSKKRKKCEIM